VSAPVKPPRLRDGGRLGIASPAYWLEPTRLDHAVGVLEGAGFEVALGPACHLREGRFAGSPQDRANELMLMFEDQSIDAIVCARGGYGVNRVLPLLDFARIARTPKIFVGYSDITGLLNSITTEAGFITFHGPMLTTWGKVSNPYNLQQFTRLLSGEQDVEIKSANQCMARTLQTGNAHGKLLGGNLTLMCERLGTRHRVETRDAILLLEDIDEKLYAFDRMMRQLRDSGCLDHIRGLVVGELLEMSDTEIPFGMDTDEIIMDACRGLDIPVVSNFSCGHGETQATLPIGYEIELDAGGQVPLIKVPDSPVH
jgi:muramoyltetrapeptide carboxypeptidase